MRIFNRFRSLHIHVLLWLIVPFTVILTIALGAILFAFQNNVTQLVLERHQQMANLAAVTVSQGIEGDAHILEALRDRSALHDSSEEVRRTALLQSAEALVDFTAGVIQLDRQGRVITAIPGLPLARWNALPDPALFHRLQDSQQPIFSNVTSIQEGKQGILIAVPVRDESGVFSGAVIGGIDISAPDNPIATAIQKLTTSTPGIAYLVDEKGMVISHPDPAEIGKNYNMTLSLGEAVRGNRGGSLWRSVDGERLVGAEALVMPSGWSVVVKEPWDAITQPARRYTIITLIFVLVALVLFFFLSWMGTHQVTAPILNLSRSTQLLASGKDVPDIAKSRIREIDDLSAAFLKMGQQISSYRDGMRNYVEAITQSQEEERLRIARELHDDTIQNLLAVFRRLDLIIATEKDPQKLQQLCALHDMVEQTLQGVRLISQDLRPMMLEDLGFAPAVQMLVRKAHEGQGAVPDARLTVNGKTQPLPADAELALYRIVQEALTNVRKHARATSVEVTIDYRPSLVRLTIADDGLGFVVPASFTELVQAGNLGLMGIQERVWAVGGSLKVESRLEQGTKITIMVPLSTNKVLESSELDELRVEDSQETDHSDYSASSSIR